MTTCLGNGCSFGLLCVSCANVFDFVCVILSFGAEDRMWDLIVLY